MKDHPGIRVLIVDDESSVCESLADYLEDYDFEVSSAASAEEALALLAKGPQDVALIDVRLPGLSGDVLVLKAHQIQPDLHFLIHTGSSAYSLSEELKQIGIRWEHVFFKPVRDLCLVKQAIENLVKKEQKTNARS